MNDPIYLGIEVKLTGQDGNVFNLLARCVAAAREAGLKKSDIDMFIYEATSGDYDHFLVTAQKWFTVT